MTRGYDGSIRIDTKLDERGLSKGIQNMGSKIKDMGLQMAVGAARMAVGFVKAVTVVGLVVFAVTRLIRGIANAVNRIISMGANTQALKEDFAALRASVRNAFLPLLQVALPLLQRVAQWLTRIFNIIGQVMGALMGQTQVMQAGADAAGDAAGGAGKMAKETKKAEKAAKGALAAFDDINVLEIESPIEEEAPDEGMGGGGGVGDGFSMVPISQEIQDFVQKVKDFFAPVKEALSGLWDSLVGLWEATKLAFAPWFEWLGESNRDLIINGIDWLSERIQELTEWIGENEAAWRIIVTVLTVIGIALLIIISPALQVIAIIAAVIAVVLLLINYWPQISAAAVAAWEWIKRVWGIVPNWFTNTIWQPLKTAAGAAFEWIGIVVHNAWMVIKAIFGPVVTWFLSKVLNPLKKAFGIVLDAIALVWDDVWETMSTIVKGVINVIIDGLNLLMSLMVGFLNVFIRLGNKLSAIIPGWIEVPELIAPKIPRLATGAVIPPNSQFLAVLGDQRSGRNLEAPEDLIRQIVREESGGGQEVTINFAGSLGALVRELKPYIDKENARIGRNLVTGGAR